LRIRAAWNVTVCRWVGGCGHFEDYDAFIFKRQTVKEERRYFTLNMFKKPNQ